MSVEDMASKILPPLGAIIGNGKPMNWLVTNKWSNIKEIPKVDKLPMLLLASEQVCMGSLRGGGARKGGGGSGRGARKGGGGRKGGEGRKAGGGKEGSLSRYV